ncbi:MAG: isocitrate/isopropylmalate family dehydrogenase, partial [Candidatus Micrarchaeota archaeon]
FEPTHGSAPKYAGMGVVNPCGMILSVVMMLDYLGEKEKAERLHDAVRTTLLHGKKLTRDLGGTAKTGEMVDDFIANLG